MKFDLSKDISTCGRFFRDCVFIDTGPLMLLFYGEYDKKNNTNFLKKEGYESIHFTSLVTFLRGIPTDRLRLMITPHVFTEFYKHAQADFNNKFNSFFNECIDYMLKIEEKTVNKNDIMVHENFIKFEIGELSLFCLREPLHHSKFHSIIHHDNPICEQLDKDKNILTIHDIDHIYSWYLSNLNK